mgnify:CR=1 FL=1
MKYFDIGWAIAIFCIGFIGLSVYFDGQKKFDTYVYFRQTYATGFQDSALAVIPTIDSAKITVFYESPQRQFPTGAWCIAYMVGSNSHYRYYAQPSVVKITPYLVFSTRK